MYEIYFSQIREDSKVERYFKNPHASERIVCIGSGGCTAFSLLDDSVRNVYAVDVNRAQCALIELKRAAIGKLDRNAFLGFIGEISMLHRIEVYEDLRDSLPSYARKYWDQHRVKIAHGINYVGVTERFYRLVGENLRNSVCGEAAIKALFSCASVEEQRQLFQSEFNTEAWRTAIRVLMSKSTQLVFYPSFWFADSGEGDFGAFFLEQFDKEIQTKRICDNYFLSQLFFGSYIHNQTEGAPHYLSPEGFASAKRNLDKLTVINNSLQSGLQKLADIDAFFLSNVFDWGKEADRFSVCDAVLKAKSDEALLLYRNMYSQVSLSPMLVDRFDADEVLSRELHWMERSMLYRRLTAGVLR
ncbi:MAG: BtaA family protein [Burkholderiaceae bacterium]|nr:BtaA family protein [Burkholderiaceae bacterium]